MPFDKTAPKDIRDGLTASGEAGGLNIIQAGNTESISDIIRFVLEIDKLKGALRKVKPAGGDPLRKHRRTQLADRIICILPRTGCGDISGCQPGDCDASHS
jgi:hypothetical protein